MSRESVRELQKTAYEMRRRVHDKTRRGECEGTGQEEQCSTCENAYYCTELRHIRSLFLF